MPGNTLRKNESSALRDADSDKASVDLDALLSKLSGNHNQVLRCLGIFKKDSPELLERIRNGIKNKNVKESKNSCHGLRGMLIIMEMRRAATLALTMETVILGKNFETCEALLLKLKNEINTAVNFIEASINPD